MTDTMPTVRATTEILRRRRARARRRREGMTLVEIMIVVIIMALIAAAVGFAVLPRLAEARNQQAETDALAVRSAVELYLANDPTADCPSMSDLVEERILSSSTRTEDPWGNEFNIECDGIDISVSSNGADGQAGTEDDVRP
jgi:general secretion pathway protein G